MYFLRNPAPRSVVLPYYRKLLASTILGGLALAGPETYAAILQVDTPNNVTVDEPNSGSRTVTMNLRASFADGDPNWQTQAACTISGEIAVITPEAQNHAQATEGVDFNIVTRTFSMPTPPPSEGPFPNISTEIVFEILDDGDESEATEEINFRITSYGVTCSDEVNRSISLNRGYGSIVINDPFDVKGSQAQSPAAIPVRQKSLSTQLNSLRTLSLHNSVTRDRSIAKEIDRARQKRGFSSNNLQVRLQGETLPVAGLLGGAAGDADFGRWGFFVTGNVDIGEQEKHSPADLDYRSNMLIAGVDYKLSDNFVLGGAITHADMDAGNDETANTDFNRYSLSVFGSFYTRDAFYIDAMLTYGSSSYDLDRRIPVDGGAADTAFADTDGDELSASIGAGYSFHQRNFRTRLFSFLNYVDANIEGYSESVSGTSSSASVDGLDLQSLIANLGVEFSWNINTSAGIFTPTFSVAQERQYADDSVYVTGRFIGGQDAGDFAYTAPNRDDNYLNAQAGISAVLKNGVSAFLTYDTFVDRKDFASGQWSVGARWEF